MKTFYWGDSQFRGSVHYHHGETWLFVGKHGAGEVAEHHIGRGLKYWMWLGHI